MFCFSCLLGLPVRTSQFLYLLFHLLQLFLRVFSLRILICCSVCCLALWRPSYVLSPSLPVFSPPLHPVLSLLGPASTSGASQAVSSWQPWLVPSGPTHLPLLFGSSCVALSLVLSDLGLCILLSSFCVWLSPLLPSSWKLPEGQC